MILRRCRLVHLVLWIAWTLFCQCFVEAWAPMSTTKERSSTHRLKATSSSDLKGNRRSKKGKKDSVVHRLAQAAARASASRKNAEEDKTDITPQAEPPRLASLQDLTNAIDRQLQSPAMMDARRPARDSMVAVVSHNQQIHNETETRHVAVILAKALMDDQITVEYANRVRRLVKAMKEEEDYCPDAICFVGGLSGNNRIADADAGYLFFRHLCAAQNVVLPNSTVIDLERTSIQQGALQHITHFLKQVCLPKWTKGIQSYETDPQFLRRRRKRLPVHFSLISSEYHLCQLNDIHARSPGQSPFHTLENWSRSKVKVTWSFQYSSTMLPVQSDPALAFLSKHYKTGQQLIPVLQNLRGVVDNREFFQRDNYRVLVAARRRLVSDMENLYHLQPSLQAIHKLSSDQPMDVILEGALLNLGRCLDLVRPAGLLTGSVTLEEWRMALSVLEQAVHQISQACDPDQPLEPSEWGKMGESNEEELDQDETTTTNQSAIHKDEDIDVTPQS